MDILEVYFDDIKYFPTPGIVPWKEEDGSMSFLQGGCVPGSLVRIPVEICSGYELKEVN